MTEKEFDIWKDHSLNYLEMAQNHDRLETIVNPDGYGKHTADCGDSVEVFLVVEDDVVKNISFRIEGCLNTLAAANAMGYMTEGKKVEEAWDMEPETIVEYLETMPEASEHCAELATEALRQALTDLQDKKRAPWKKLYGVR